MEKKGKRIIGIKGFGRSGQGHFDRRRIVDTEVKRLVPYTAFLFPFHDCGAVFDGLGHPSKNNEYKVRIAILGVDSGKEIVMTRLAITEAGPGYLP